MDTRSDLSQSNGSITVFRADKRNVGDWWSPPVRYFPLRAIDEIDLVGDHGALRSRSLVIVGGGGLGQVGMVEHIERLARDDRPYKLVAWGVGADTITDRKGILEAGEADTALHDVYGKFDVIGTRIHSSDDYRGDGRFSWVPCASSMHPALLKLRHTRPTKAIGVYSHRRVPVDTSLIADIAKSRGQTGFFGRLPSENNTGMDIVAKLTFMAQFEFIVTNSYHGVFWATLLGRKVVCIPFKNGLFSFRHPPAYLDAKEPARAFDEAVTYRDALDECRFANIGFYSRLVDRFGDF